MKETPCLPLRTILLPLPLARRRRRLCVVVVPAPLTFAGPSHSPSSFSLSPSLTSGPSSLSPCLSACLSSNLDEPITPPPPALTPALITPTASIRPPRQPPPPFAATRLEIKSQLFSFPTPFCTHTLHTTRLFHTPRDTRPHTPTHINTHCPVHHPTHYPLSRHNMCLRAWVCIALSACNLLRRAQGASSSFFSERHAWRIRWIATPTCLAKRRARLVARSSVLIALSGPND